MSTIADRFIVLIESTISESRRFKVLEEMSEIPAVSWRKAYLRGQRPTAEMIEVIARKFPEYAFWLVTGETDNEFSHMSPKQDSQLDVPFQSRPAGVEFLRFKISTMKNASDEQRHTLVDRWEDWLTCHQEKNSKRWPWLYSVHPKLVERKVRNEKLMRDQDELIESAARQLGSYRAKRLAEFEALKDVSNGD